MSRSPELKPNEVLQHYLDDLLSSPEEPSQIGYADPLEEQRERLQKLLYSAVPQARTSTSTKTNPKINPAPTATSQVAAQKSAVVVEPVQIETAPDSTHRVNPVEPLVNLVQPEPSPPTVNDSQLEFERAERQAEIELAEEARLAALETQKVPEPARENVQEDELEPGEHPFEMPGVEWLDNGRPAWAQKRFDVLLFKVSGLTLAVPLISLGQIQPMNDDLTPLFGQADWFMGLLPTPAGKIRTVNTAKFVMPERYDENFVRTAQYVISIDGVPWGLAVDSVNQPISLDPEDVKWRSERSRRPWLAGTVKEHMCALLDIPRVGQLLMEADTRRRA